MARDPDAKLDTPTFFKHDIERIAKESVAPIVADLVEKAIDDGEIDIKDNVEEVLGDAEDGTIVKVLGLDADGGLVKGTVSGGTKLYKHTISYTKDDGETAPQTYGIVLISKSSSPVINQLDLETLVQNALQILTVSGVLSGDTIVGATGSMLGEAVGVIVDSEGTYYNKQLFISSVTSVSDTVTEL